MAVKTTDEVVGFLRDASDRAASGALPEGFGVFARTYLRMTLEELACTSQRSFFHDPAWMAEFTVRFAARYELALTDPTRRARPWAVAFDTSARGGRCVIRDLLLGVNAHMSYDLAMVLVEGLIGPDPTPEQHADFDKVNAVIARAVDPVQRTLERRFGAWLGGADVLAGRFDEYVTIEAFSAMREQAWTDALAILRGAHDEAWLSTKVAWKASVLTHIPF
jgi:hypothetical protein